MFDLDDMTDEQRTEHDATVTRAVCFFKYADADHWTVRRARQLVDDGLRGHVESTTASLDHETSLPRSWHQQLNGVTELLTTSVSGEIGVAR